MTIVFGAEGSGAAAQSTAGPGLIEEPITQPILETIGEPLAAPGEAAVPVKEEAAPQPARSASLAALVSSQPQPAELSRELNCLAGAIFFEAKSETLNGQLAVGRVVVARAKSGRFPNSYCGVVFQPSQFSFVRGNSLPTGARHARQWKNAVAVAQIAHEGTWRSPVEGALFFHAAYVSPGWRLTRMARVDNHVFYR